MNVVLEVDSKPQIESPDTEIHHRTTETNYPRVASIKPFVKHDAMMFNGRTRPVLFVVIHDDSIHKPHTAKGIGRSGGVGDLI